MTGETKTTINHEKIQKWVEERDGKPATIAPEEMVGILKIDFPEVDQGEDKFRVISWEEFFDEFELKELAFIYQDETGSGDRSMYYTFVKR